MSRSPVAFLSPEFFAARAAGASGYRARCLAVAALRPAPGCPVPVVAVPPPGAVRSAPDRAGQFFRLQVRLPRGGWGLSGFGGCRLDLVDFAAVAFPSRSVRVVAE